MPELFSYTPAELYLLNAAPKALYQPALMLTLKDLSLKDVIDIRTEKVEMRGRSKKYRDMINIVAFNNFEVHQWQPHEIYFKNALNHYKGQSTLINCLAYVDNHLSSEAKYGKLIIQKRLGKCFQWLNWRFYTLSGKLSSQGKRLKQQLNLELKNYISELKSELKDKPVEAWELLNDLNGFLYLAPLKDMDDIVYILSKQNQKILGSKAEHDVYSFFVEMEKIKAFDHYIDKVLNARNRSSQRSRRTIFGRRPY